MELGGFSAGHVISGSPIMKTMTVLNAIDNIYVVYVERTMRATQSLPQSHPFCFGGKLIFVAQEQAKRALASRNLLRRGLKMAATLSDTVSFKVSLLVSPILGLT